MDIRSTKLRAVETLLSLPHPTAPRSFLRFGRWYLAECLFHRDGADNLSQLRRLSPDIERALAKTAAAAPQDAGEQAPLACAAVHAGNNLRSFYPVRGLTVKVQGSGRNAGDIKNDLDARNLARSLGFRNLPQTLYFGSVEDRAFLADEFICGRRPRASDAGILLDRLIPDMFGLYRSIGCSLTPARAVLDLDQTIADIARFPIPDDLLLERTCREQVLRRLEELRPLMDLPLLAVRGHGDISNGNLILTDDGDYRLLDWKHARTLPATWDFRKLLAMVPGVQAVLIPLVAAAMRELGSPDAMHAADQCFLAACARLTERGRNDWSPKPATQRRWLEELRHVAVFVCLCRPGSRERHHAR